MKFVDKINLNINTDTIKAFCKDIGDLSNLPNVIHVAGTNGKGSTVAFLQSILQAHGFTVNTFTSPHLVSELERIRIKGKLISRNLHNKLECFVNNHPIGKQLSFFEKYVAKAFLAFKDNPADFTILEVGLGGRLDATNVVDNPRLSIITPIDLDHQHILGETRSLIAKEKIAILPFKGILVSAYQTEEVIKVLVEHAQKKQAQKVLIGGKDWFLSKEHGSNKIVNLKNNPPDYYLKSADINLKLEHVGLKGEHQFYNAALAIVALFQIIPNKLKVPAINKGLQEVKWCGRLQPLKEVYQRQIPAGVTLLIDGAHNVHGASALVDYLLKYHPDAELHIILGMMKTKKLCGYLEQLKKLTNFNLYTVNLPQGFSGYSSEEIYQEARKAGLPTVNARFVKSALNKLLFNTKGALNEDDFKVDKSPKVVVICGSLYLLGKVLKDSKLYPN